MEFSVISLNLSINNHFLKKYYRITETSIKSPNNNYVDLAKDATSYKAFYKTIGLKLYQNDVIYVKKTIQKLTQGR